MDKLHFCGGLPRSGSTILMNIIQQNPNIFTTGTCALHGILEQHILIKSRYREQFQAMSVQQADKAMYGLIHGATKGWFEALTNKSTVISKNRSWSSIFHLFPNSKYIVMVRDLRDVVDSFEKINQKTQALHSYGDRSVLVPAMSMNEKYSYYFEEPNVITGSLFTEIPRLMELFKKTKNKVKFIRYEDFTKEPILILKNLYEFLNEPLYNHNLDNIEQSFLYEHDHAYFRERTDHVTKKSFVYYKEPKRSLPEEFNDKILKQFRWFYEGFYPEELKK